MWCHSDATLTFDIPNRPPAIAVSEAALTVDEGQTAANGGTMSSTATVVVETPAAAALTLANAVNPV